MEYASGGELFNKITAVGKIAENEAKNLFAQVISAVEFMVSCISSFLYSSLKNRKILSDYAKEKISSLWLIIILLMPMEFFEAKLLHLKPHIKWRWMDSFLLQPSDKAG
jgi:hypothetical protein